MSGKEDVKRHVLTMRITPDMRAQIQRAAEKSGRSISQEVELRLEQSLLADAGLGGVTQANLLREMTAVMDHASSALGQAWHSEHVGWRLVNDGVEFLIRTTEPEKTRPIEELISGEGLAAVEQWRQSITQDEEELLNRLRERDQLELKEAASLLDDRERRRLDYLRSLKVAKMPAKPKLNKSDAEHWAEAEDTRIKGNRMFARIEPVLRDAMSRARKTAATMRRAT